jgi:hypothetical protein
LCHWIADEIVHDPQSLLLWRVNQHTEKPTMQVTTQFSHFTVKDILNVSPPIYGPRSPLCHKLYYTKLPVKLTELDNYRHLVLKVLGEKFQLSVSAQTNL